MKDMNSSVAGANRRLYLAVWVDAVLGLGVLAALTGIAWAMAWMVR